MPNLASRDRMLRAISLEDVDHTPCCFMSFSALRKRLNNDRYEVVKAQLEMGLDAMLFIPSAPRPARPEHPDLRGLPVRFDSTVTVAEWPGRGSSGAQLSKKYTTPAGDLTTSVRLSDDWPHGDHIPFIDDYQVPRVDKPLVTGAEDLRALRYLMLAPQEADVAAYRDEVKKARAFADEQGVLLAGGWGIGMDMANWLCGMQPLMVLMIEQPDFVTDLLEMIHVWNRQRMEVVLSAPVDLYIRRAWYEGCDFVTPRFYHDAILPRLKAEVELAHAHDARFGYICSSGTTPMLDFYSDAGVDVLIGVDPIQGTYTDMPLMKQKLGGTTCLWGGVSAAVTIEMGNEADVRSAVRRALDTLGPEGHVLAPIDNITVDEPLTWQNIDNLIDEWRRHW